MIDKPQIGCINHVLDAYRQAKKIHVTVFFSGAITGIQIHSFKSQSVLLQVSALPS